MARKRQKQKRQKQTLLPVMAPGQNMREIIKQCIMLEDHLVQPRKRCADCTSKHMLAIEALAEECGTLCSPSANRDVAAEAAKVAQNARVLHHAWATNPRDPATCRAVAANLRRMRKELMSKYATLPVGALPSEEARMVAKVTGAAGAGARRKVSARRAGRASATRA